MKVEKALYIKDFRHAGRIFDTVLIPKRIINNGRNVKFFVVDLLKISILC